MVRIGALAVAVLALLLAGCGTVHAGAGTAGGPEASASPAQWRTYGPADDQLVSPSVDSSGRVLTVGVQMPTGRYGCERELAGKVTKFDQTYAFVSITYQSRLWLDARACPWRVVTVRVSLPAPLGQRNVYFNGDTIFLASHGKLILQCEALNGTGCGIPSTPSTHWFFRATPRGWETITASRTAGCALVHKADPQFPARLCAALPALPG